MVDSSASDGTRTARLRADKAVVGSTSAFAAILLVGAFVPGVRGNTLTILLIASVLALVVALMMRTIRNQIANAASAPTLPSIGTDQTSVLTSKTSTDVEHPLGKHTANTSHAHDAETSAGGWGLAFVVAALGVNAVISMLAYRYALQNVTYPWLSHQYVLSVFTLGLGARWLEGRQSVAFGRGVAITVFAMFLYSIARSILFEDIIFGCAALVDRCKWAYFWSFTRSNILFVVVVASTWRAWYVFTRAREHGQEPEARAPW